MVTSAEVIVSIPISPLFHNGDNWEEDKKDGGKKENRRKRKVMVVGSRRVETKRL